MQVGAAGESGRADVADDLPLPHPLAGMEPRGEAAQVAVTGGDSVEVPELDQISVSSGAFGAQDGTVSGGEDRSPRRSELPSAS